MATEEVRTVSQETQILAHLKRGRTLTPLNSLNLFGTMRLAARIYALRQKGHDIKRDQVTLPSGKRIAMYYL